MTAFDQFQRYRLASDLIQLIAGQQGWKVLEVGASTSPLASMIPNQTVFVDVQFAEKETSPALAVQASGLALPFVNETFGVVISLDTLEHIEPENRMKFLSELQRVTSEVLILGFPPDEPLVNAADRILYEFVQTETGQDNRFLREHIHHRLPNSAEIRSNLQPNFKEMLVLQNAQISSWLLLQMATFLNDSRPEFVGISRLMNEFFQKHYEALSHDPPCYRTVFVCSKKPLLQPLKERIAEMATPTRNETLQFAEACYAITSLYSGSLKARSKEFESKLDVLQKKVRLQEKELHIKEGLLQDQAVRIENLREYLSLFLNHPIYKLFKRMKSIYERIRSRLLPRRLFDSSSTTTFAVSDHHKIWMHQRKPLISVVTILERNELNDLRKTCDSILKQTYDQWHWNLVDATGDSAIEEYINAIADQNERISILKVSHGSDASSCLNEGIRFADGEFALLLACGDRLHPQAIFCVAEAICEQPDMDGFYSDESRTDEGGRQEEPLFKPDWSPEMMLSFNLFACLGAFRLSLLKKIAPLDPELNGAQDWDLAFRVSETTNRIHHIPKILCAGRKTSPSKSVQKAQARCVANHLLRLGLTNPKISFESSDPIRKTYPVVIWDADISRKISIVIPSKDHPEIVKNCLKSLFEVTDFSNFDVVVVDTGSTDPKTWDLYSHYSANGKFKVVHYSDPFNFSKACNFGAKHCTGDIFVFLNNDTVILQKDWLTRLSMWLEVPGIDIVGCKLLYPNRTIQHAGVIVGFGGLAAHLFEQKSENIITPFGTDGWYRNLSAVTGACMMISRKSFEAVEGFDERFVINFSDVDLCLRVTRSGGRIVYTPDVKLIHLESVSHGRRIPRSDLELASEKWAQILSEGDPFFNRNLSYYSTTPRIARTLEESPLLINQAIMSRLPEKEILLLPDDLVGR